MKAAWKALVSGCGNSEMIGFVCIFHHLEEELYKTFISYSGRQIHGHQMPKRKYGHRTKNEKMDSDKSK